MIRLTLAQARRLGVRIPPAPSAGRSTVVLGRKSQATRTPENVLWAAVSALYPSAEREFAGAVPERRFRIDIALPAERLAVEVDGWQYHGKYRRAHQADRERQNLLAIEGWLVLRFTAGQILNDMPSVLATIEAALARQRLVS